MSAPERISVWVNETLPDGICFGGWTSRENTALDDAEYVRLSEEMAALIDAAKIYKASLNDGFGHGAARLNLTQAALNLARSRSETKP